MIIASNIAFVRNRENSLFAALILQNNSRLWCSLESNKRFIPTWVFFCGVRLPSRTFIYAITVLAVVIIAGGVAWTFFGSDEPDTPSVPDNSLPVSGNPSGPSWFGNPQTTEPSGNSSETPGESLVTVDEEARDAAVAFMKSTHPGIAQYLSDLSWNGGWIDSEEENTEAYVYYAQEWTFTVKWQSVSNPVYKISAQYASETTTIVWEGSYQNGVVKETSFSYAP
jgi:hypothetical protein